MTEAKNQESKIEKIEGDFFDRQKLIEILSKYIDILKKDAVIAIDAPWGTGKSWFGSKWTDYLKKEGHKVIFIDAFKQDYVEDPFLLIAAEINILAKDSSTSAELQKNAISVLKNLVPFGTKILMKGIGIASMGIVDIEKGYVDLVKKANEDIADNTSKWITKEFEGFENAKASFDDYKKTLENFCDKQTKPVVIFIDELDRCRPSFAVQLLERIKHLFDVPNLIFVLLMNKNQLEKAIEGVYGSGTDAKGYLSKFINLFLHLPEINFTEYYREVNSSPASKFIYSVLKNYKFDADSQINHHLFIHNLTVWTYIKKLSLRDIERACTIFALSGAKGNAGLLTYLIVLKLKHSDLFLELLQGKIKESSQKAIAILKEEEERFKDINIKEEHVMTTRKEAKIYLRAFQELHQLQTNKKLTLLILGNYGRLIFNRSFTGNYDGVEKFFTDNLNLIDLPIIFDPKE